MRHPGIQADGIRSTLARNIRTASVENLNDRRIRQLLEDNRALRIRIRTVASGNAAMRELLLRRAS